jgi:hypothetical protein
VPLLYIEDSRDREFYDPLYYLRSDVFTIETFFSLECDGNVTKNWRVFAVNPANGETLYEVNMDANPTRTSSSLLIFDSFLSYGRYAMVIQVNTTISETTKFLNEKKTFIEILPSGMDVAALPGGITEVSVGYKQDIHFKPAVHSKDYDNIISPSQLNYTFYCQVIDNGIESGYPTKSVGVLADIASLDDSMLNPNTTCFRRRADFTLFDNGLLVKGGALKFHPNRVYKFKIQTEIPSNYTLVYTQEIKVVVENVFRLPVLNISCYPYETCVPYGGFQIINANAQTIINGNCVDGCEELTEDAWYKWNLYKLTDIGSKRLLIEFL